MRKYLLWVALVSSIVVAGGTAGAAGARGAGQVVPPVGAAGIVGALGVADVTWAAGDSAADPVVDRLQAYLDQKDYFRLKTALQEAAPHLKALDRLYFQAFVDNAFADNETSLKEIQALLLADVLTKKQQYALWSIREDNYYKMGRYRLARESCDTILNRYLDEINTLKRNDLANDRMLWGALEEVPPQEVSLPGPTHVRWKRDAGGLMSVPVRKGEQMFDFVFDTGAGLSTISESFASQLHLHLKNVSVDVQSSTGIHNTSMLAVADSLYLGDVLMQHVVFLVLPDSQLSFPPIHYVIHAILGLPVISQLQEIHILKDGGLIIQPSSMQKPSNLALDGWIPVVCITTDEDTLSFHLDTGANTTDLFSPYLLKHSERVLREGKREISTRGGAGGIVSTPVIRLSHFSLSVGGQKVTLPYVDVLASPTDPGGEKYYGNLGQDVISHFPEMVLNFKYMYLNFPTAF